MSTLISRLNRLLAGLFTPVSQTVDPDSMQLAQWADLPVHHPVCR